MLLLDDNESDINKKILCTFRLEQDVRVCQIFTFRCSSFCLCVRFLSQQKKGGRVVKMRGFGKI